MASRGRASASSSQSADVGDPVVIESPTVEPKEARLQAVSIKELLEAGVHFGHQTQKWNPKVKPYIFGQRNGIYIIDLQKTVRLFNDACAFARRLGEEGKSILFVGTKRQAQEAIREEAVRSGNPYVNQRWLGGLLTNWATVRRSAETLRKLEELQKDEAREAMTKKELARAEKKRAKLAKVFTGIKDMRKLPEALFVIDPKNERIAIAEANRLGIPVIGVLDTNCDPDGIDFVVPGNDDAIRSIRLFAGRVADAFLDGAGLRQALRADAGADQEATTPAGGADSRAARAARPDAAPPAAPVEPPRKRITLTVPPGGQAPKPATSTGAPAHGETTTVKAG